MSNRGRPRKSNEELKLGGSRNEKVGQIESGALENPTQAPDCLSLQAREHWAILIPPLLEAGTIREADRMNLGIICADLATFHDRSVNAKTGLPNVDEKDRQRIGKRIADNSAKFGMSPLDRARSGVNKKTAGVKTRPQ